MELVPTPPLGPCIENSGRHNLDLEASRLRIIEGGSWKKQDVVMLLPAGRMVPTKAALSWMNLIFPPNNGVARIVMQGIEVGEAYCQAIENVLAHPQLSTFKWILTVEHDNIPPQGGVLDLLKRMEAHPEMAAISGLYWTKGEGGAPQIWGDIRDPVPNYRPQPPRPGELVECYGIGMGFALWRLEMFKDPKLRKPWFKTLAGVNEGLGTQDLYFWGDARKCGYRCAVDCGVLVGHLDPATEIIW